MTTQHATPNVKDFPGFNLPRENWSKLPHALIEQFDRISTVSELKVLLYVLRHTWGYQMYDDGRRITLDEFAHGRKRRNASRMDRGTGLSYNAIRAGVRAAIEHGFLIRDYDGHDTARASYVYRLRMESEDAAPVPQEAAPAADDGQGYRTLIRKDCTVQPLTTRGSNSEHRSEKESTERKKNTPPSADGGEGIGVSANRGSSESEGNADFDSLFPPRAGPVDLPPPFSVPEGMSAAETLRRRGMAAHAAAMAHASAVCRGPTLGPWETNRFVQAWKAAHPAAHPGDILALGQALEDRLGMRPDWGRKADVASWLSGLEKALRLADGDRHLVVSVALAMREQGLAIPEPYSLVKMVRDAAAQTRATSGGARCIQWLN